MNYAMVVTTHSYLFLRFDRYYRASRVAGAAASHAATPYCTYFLARIASHKIVPSLSQKAKNGLFGPLSIPMHICTLATNSYSEIYFELI